MTDNLYKRKYECIRGYFLIFFFVAAVMPLIHWVCGIDNDSFHLTALN